MTMTVAENEASGAAGTIVVKDQEGPLEFTGTLVADLSWNYAIAETYGHKRWTDLTLYRVMEPGSEYEYVLQVVGRSVVYHRAGGSCRSGINLPVGVVMRDMERYRALKACAECRPEDLDFFDEYETIAVEEDLPTLYRCRDAAEFIGVMNSRIQRERNKNGLSKKLLNVASSVDPAIAAAQVRTRRL
jgi:hypothetical protein